MVYTISYLVFVTGNISDLLEIPSGLQGENGLQNSKKLKNVVHEIVAINAINFFF
jgi:hypothetical protein